MNKLFLFIIFISGNALAVNPEAVIILEESNSRGHVFSKNVVIVKEGSVMVNKEKLSPSEIITQSPHITTIARFKNGTNTSQCETGFFRHLLKKGKVIKIEQGCLSSERFKLLKESFKALRKDRVTE